MPSNFLTILSDDDETHDALVKAFDERFPPNALDSYWGVQKASEKHTAAHYAQRERVTTLQSMKRDWQHHVNSYDRDVARGMEHPPSEVKKYNASKKKIAQADAEILSLRNEPQTPNLPAETLAEFILDSRGKFDAAATDVKLPKGQSPSEALTASRANLDSIKSRRASVNNEPLPFDESVKQLKADVYAKARGLNVRPLTKLVAPDSGYVSARGPGAAPSQGRLEWPVQQEVKEGGRYFDLDQGNGLIAWLFPEALVERGIAELKNLYKGRTGLSIQERARLIAEIDAEILAEERREEAIIRICEDAGLTVYRRPLAVLGIAPA
jgi:hypothetical protein